MLEMMILFAVGLLIPILIFRFLIRRWTGYDPTYLADRYHADFLQRGIKEYMDKLDADSIPDRKTRKAKDLSYYDRAAEANASQEMPDTSRLELPPLPPENEFQDEASVGDMLKRQSKQER